MVPNILGMRHFNLVARYLLLLILDDIVLLKLQPLFESYVKYDIVLEMKCANVVSPVCIVHDSVVNLELGKETAITSIVVKLDGFYEVGCVIRIVLISFDHGHIALLRLYYVQ